MAGKVTTLQPLKNEHKLRGGLDKKGKGRWGRVQNVSGEGGG